jgi:hypothetical protein
MLSARFFGFIPVKYLDDFLLTKGTSLRVASGIYFVGRK